MTPPVEPVEPVTEWGALGGIAAYDERKRLDNSGDGYAYYVEERRGEVYPMREYRIVRARRVSPTNR